jgi:hypothetical protein
MITKAHCVICETEHALAVVFAYHDTLKKNGGPNGLMRFIQPSPGEL